MPVDAFLATWHMDARLDKGYYIADLITEVLGGGASSRLYQQLVKEQRLFASIDCYHFGTVEKGLVAVDGKLAEGVAIEQAEAAVQAVLQQVQEEVINDHELAKVKNKTESVIAFEDMNVMSRANSLAFYELLGDAQLMNDELQRYQEITATDIRTYSQQLFAPTNSNVLHYLRKNK